MNRPRRNILATLFLVAAVSLVTEVRASLLLSTDFTGRTVAGNTASNITWTTVGVADPGDLTAVEVPDMNPVGLLNGLFDTPNAQGHFAPDLNIENQNPWTVDIPITFAGPTSQVTLSSVVIDRQNFNNSGGNQTGGNHPVRWIATLIGSLSGAGTPITVVSPTGNSSIDTLTFGTPAVLDDTQTWVLQIKAEEPINRPGNNTGFDALTVYGVANPEPSTFLSLLAITVSAMLGRRRRQLAA